MGSMSFRLRGRRRLRSGGVVPAKSAPGPRAELVIPGSSHVVPLEKPGLVNRMILDFLADEQPTKLFALRDSLPEYLR